MLACSVVPSLTIGVVDGGGDQCDGSDLSDLGIGELTELTDSLHDSFYRRFVGLRAWSRDATALSKRGKAAVPRTGQVLWHRHRAADGQGRCVAGVVAAPGGGVCPFGFLF